MSRFSRHFSSFSFKFCHIVSFPISIYSFPTYTCDYFSSFLLYKALLPRHSVSFRSFSITSAVHFISSQHSSLSGSDFKRSPHLYRWILNFLSSPFRCYSVTHLSVSIHLGQHALTPQLPQCHHQHDNIIAVHKTTLHIKTPLFLEINHKIGWHKPQLVSRPHQ